MQVDHVFTRQVDDILDRAYEKMFEQIEFARKDRSAKEIGEYLGKHWDLEDQWRDWWETCDEEYK